ncbi:MAG: hypothetical protein GY716_11485 [bacterium]|nr:hypothetical protein [bacterium]
MGLWAPVAAFVAIVYGLSAQPRIEGLDFAWDKALHFGAYAVFGALCMRACHGGFRPARAAATAAALAIALGYGALDEWHQSMVPGRDPSFLDWIADALGAGTSAVLHSLVFRRSE